MERKRTLSVLDEKQLNDEEKEESSFELETDAEKLDDKQPRNEEKETSSESDKDVDEKGMF